MQQYGRPYLGQRFRQIHDNGLRYKYGTLAGLEMSKRPDGTTVSWRAIIVSGFSNPEKIHSTASWTTPAQWHPCPPDDENYVSDGADRPAVAAEGSGLLHSIAALEEGLRNQRDDVRMAALTEQVDQLQADMVGLGVACARKVDGDKNAALDARVKLLEEQLASRCAQVPPSESTPSKREFKKA